MKTFLHLILLTSLLSLGRLGAADRGPAAPTPAIPAGKELAALDQFLSLSNEDLDQMQRVIARIRAMSSEEKAALRREMDQFRRLPDEQRRQLRQGWGGMEEGIKDAWRRMMQSASAERRDEIQANLQVLTQEEKMAYRRQLVEEFLQGEEKNNQRL
jgi:hypothetical protein